MTPKEAKNLIAQVAQEYLGEHWKNKLTKTQGQIWADAIAGWYYPCAESAVKTLFMRHQSYRNEFNFKMPPMDILKHYYDVGIEVYVDYCPCCNGSGWVRFASDSRMRQCDHTRQPLSDEVCNAFDCTPKDKHPCPMGSKHYNEKMIEVTTRLKAAAAKAGIRMTRKPEETETIPF